MWCESVRRCSPDAFRAEDKWGGMGGGDQSFSGLALQCVNWKMGNNSKTSVRLVFGCETGSWGVMVCEFRLVTECGWSGIRAVVNLGTAT
jgi:hypothetical protein